MGPASEANSSKSAKPVPTGINLPIITFSFKPLNQSDLPSIAASVSTLVVSWNEAADMKLSVFRRLTE